MLSRLLTFSAVIEIIAVTTWVGGLAALAFIAAPAIFQTASSREQAGRIFGVILKRFHGVSYGCGLLILLAGAMRWAGSRRMHAAEVVRYVVAALMLGLALYSGLIVTRRIERLRATPGGGAKDEFNRLHRLATTLTAFNLLLGYALAIMLAAEE